MKIVTISTELNGRYLPTVNVPERMAAAALRELVDSVADELIDVTTSSEQKLSLSIFWQEHDV